MGKSTRTCETCGKMFTVAAHRRRHRPARFCSRGCIRVDWRPKPLHTPCETCGEPTRTHASRPKRFCSRDCYEASRPRATKTCPVCGKRFTIPAGQAARYAVCSSECKGVNMVEHVCQRCGREFTASSKRGRVYCSEGCYRPAHYHRCDNCGKRFRLPPTDVGIRRFCTFSCWRRHNGETHLETKVREALEVMGVPFEQERQVGRYSIDFALLLFGVALEVDGAYWHRDAARDARKDAAVRKCGWRVVRIGEGEVNASEDLPAFIRERVMASAQA